MIISRKKFEAEIDKAVSKREREMLDEQNRNEEMRDVWHRIHEIEDRLRNVERHLESDEDRCYCNVPCAPVK